MNIVTKKQMYIGLSLSFCISAVIRGIVNESQIAGIVTNTACKTEEQFIYVIEGYSRSYSGWQRDPERAKALAFKLYREGLLVQSRLVAKDNPRHLFLEHYPELLQERPMDDWIRVEHYEQIFGAFPSIDPLNVVDKTVCLEC
jgi:hypothetical protein